MADKPPKYCAIDFEYNGTKEAKLNLVSVAWTLSNGVTQKTWLHKDSGAKAGVKETLKHMREDGVIMVAHSVLAEGSAFIALGLDPTKFKWIDVQAEWKMLTNHRKKYRYGKQLIDGKEVRTWCPHYKSMQPKIKQKKMNSSKPSTSLAASTYKLLGKKIDTEHKTVMRDLIIAGGPFTEDAIKAILDYNLSDTEDLLAILAKHIKAYKEAKVPYSLDEMLYRGNAVAHTAIMTCRGYPVSKTIHNFSQSVPDMIKEMCEDINSQDLPVKPFRWNKKEQRYSMKQKELQDEFKKWPEAKKWPKTDTGKISLSIDAFQDVFGHRSPYPENDLAAQMTRYLRFQQSLNGFKTIAPGSKRKSFYQFFGSDRRARAYLNPYGSQSGRFQPGAAGFIPLKSNWMRWFIQPPKGKAIAGIDYGSQEYLIAALLSNDKAMIESYASGDPYLWLGKKAKFIPEEGTRKTHGTERDLMKQTALGILFNMSCYGLSYDFTRKLGRNVSPEEAQKFIDMFYKAFPVFRKWMDGFYKSYCRKGYAKLSDGWTLFGDNPNERSVKNFPIQGMGSVILRKAIRYCHDAGLKPIMPLHDALYIEYKAFDWGILEIFKDCMYRAFVDSFESDKAKLIRLDGYTWSKEFPGNRRGDVSGTDFKIRKYYLEDRGKAEFEKFKKYFLI